ncbi:MAG: SDR family oxidoreductase [Rhodobiaceae bacterium]|nr:SDR family oxidoreductase [Rhodobiaceae bacterium]MCC0056627.1 SDR family oxidoreductase [Rhodobiaceae bacterium]
MTDRLLEGRVALVTGAGRGIGRSVAMTLAAEGAKVVVNDIGAALWGDESADNPAAEVVAAIRASAGEAIANGDSVADWESASRMVAAAQDAFGRLDIVVNNAGIIRDSIVHKMSPEDFDAVIDVHVRGSFYVSRAAAPLFREQNGGCYIHMTSNAGLIGNIGQANYMAAKMGIVGLSRSLAMDLARYNVRSNCIAPFAKTRMTESVPASPDQAAARAAKIAGWRPESVGVLAATLASDACAEISGQIFGARGNEVFVFSQPRPIRSVHRDGGWTPDGLGKVLPKFGAAYSPITDATMTWDSVD